MIKRNTKMLKFQTKTVKKYKNLIYQSWLTESKLVPTLPLLLLKPLSEQFFLIVTLLTTSYCKNLKFQIQICFYSVHICNETNVRNKYHFNLNYVSYTANAQSVDSVNSQFLFSIGRLRSAFISSNICLLKAFLIC